MQHHQEWGRVGEGGVWGATVLVTYRCRQWLWHGVARWTRLSAAQPRGCAQQAAEGTILEHVGTVNAGRGRRAADGVETPRGRQGGGSPWTMAMRGWSPRMTARCSTRRRCRSPRMMAMRWKSPQTSDDIICPSLLTRTVATGE
jgi:hypothetical protein